MSVFVEREQGTNKIVGVYVQPQEGRAEEMLPDDHPEVVAFNAEMQARMNPPAASE